MRNEVRSSAIAVCCLALIATACSGGGSSGAPENRPTATPAGAERAAGPAADLSQELTGGNGPFIGEADAPNLAKAGYVQHEYVASGSAASYSPRGALARNGRWTFTADGTAPYRTRVLVRRPADRTRFSGTVVVEWLNVSGGIDAGPDFTSLQEEITRSGDVWVGVSAQLIGIEGGPVLVVAPGAQGLAGKGLKGLDPARYGSLAHPGDGYSFDIFTQVARAVRDGDAIGGTKAKYVIAAGESQSALALTTYYNGVQPLTRAFDGFFVHSRASVALPLVAPGKYADLAGSIVSPTPTIFRTDQRAPVLDLQAESDVTGVLDSAQARQRDSGRFRLWEVTGTAHADVHLVGSIASQINCGVQINNGPMHVVAKAAYHALKEWVSTGRTPARAPRLELTRAEKPEVRRDADGIALGGIRTPPVDVPVDVLSGVAGPSEDLLCILLGSTKPLDANALARRYPSRSAYERRYAAAADRAIAAGFVLRADRAALMAFAQPDRISG